MYYNAPASENAYDRGVLGHVILKHLDRDGPVERLVVRPVDDRGPPLTDQFLDRALAQRHPDQPVLEEPRVGLQAVHELGIR